MSTLIARIARALKREPVRVWCYGVAVSAVALLVFYRIIEPAAAPLWLALVAAVVVPGTEATRASVTPVAGGRHRA